MHLEKLRAQLANLKLSDVEYWDVRLEDTFETTVGIVDKEVVNCTASPSLGAYVRIRKDGFWLYESTTDTENLKQTLERLSEQKSHATGQHKYSNSKHRQYIALNSENKKFSAVPLSEKLELLQHYEELARKNPKAASTRARYKDTYKVKAFINSVGTEYEYDFNQGGLVVGYTLKDQDKLFEDRYLTYGATFNELKNLDQEINARMKESEPFIHAPAITPGKYTVLFDPEMTGIFTHESFGHKSEADFYIGNEKSLEQWRLGTQIATKQLSIVDYGGHENTSGWCPIDDEGTPMQKNYLIKDGILTSRLHSVETATLLDERPTGNSRAMNFEHRPIVRMTSTYIEPGTETAQEIMKRSEGAILLEGARHGTGLSTFTVAPGRGYKIGANGQREPVRVTVVSGTVFETLKNIVAISSDFSLESSALGGCGKNGQWPLPVADGGPFILVKDMQVS
jgi:TldD protein